MDEKQISELCNFLVDLEKEKLSEKNSKKRLVLLEKLGWTNKNECWNNDATSTYEEINVNLLRKPFIRKTDRRSKKFQEKNSGLIEVENDEEEEDDDESDEEMSCHEMETENKLMNRKSERISILSKETTEQTDITCKSYEGVLYKKNKLKQKKYIGVLIGHKLLLSHKSDGQNKDLTKIKVLKNIDLRDYEVSIAPSNGPKYELKLVCPGKKTHIYYCKSKSDADAWEKEIKKILLMNFATEKQIDTETVNEDCPLYIKGDIYQVVQDKKSASNTNLGDLKSDSNKSLDNYGCSLFQADTIATYKNDAQQSQSKAKKSKIHTIFNKVLHIRDKVLNEEKEKILLSGMLLVAIDGMEQWCNYYCIVKPQEFQIFKYSEEQVEPTTLALQECNLLQTFDQNVLLLTSPQVEVQLKFKDQTELMKWKKMLIEQIEKKTFVNGNEFETPVEGLYDEIRETYHQDPWKLNKRPALPECPMPITPDVNQVLLNINECCYMDAIECRGAIKMKGKPITTHETFNPYSNTDESTHFDGHKANNNETTSVYNIIDSTLPTSIIDNTPIAKDKSKSMTETIKYASNNQTADNKKTTFDNQIPNVNMKNDKNKPITMEKKLENTQKRHKIDNYVPNENKKININNTIQIKQSDNKVRNEAIDRDLSNTNNIKKPGSFDQNKIKGIDTAALISKFSKSNSSINSYEPISKSKSPPITCNQKLSNGHQALLRPPFGYNNSCNTNDTRDNKTNIKRYSDTSAMKSNLILEKIKMFENKKN